MADIQNRHIDDGFEADEELSEEDLFTRQLESTLLFSLSDSLAEVITGAEQNSSETFTIGNQEIKYSRGTDPENRHSQYCCGNQEFTRFLYDHN